VRVFDLNRPEAEPDVFTESGLLSHEGTVKSVVWADEHASVTASDDGTIK
jgi:serine-threonine kinase receptor-associated protein